MRYCLCFSNYINLKQICQNDFLKDLLGEFIKKKKRVAITNKISVIITLI